MTVFFSANAQFVTGRDGQRKRIAEKNTVIVTTSGMLGDEDSLAVAG
jgi:predicted metal-dependent RNase